MKRIALVLALLGVLFTSGASVADARPQPRDNVFITLTCTEDVQGVTVVTFDQQKADEHDLLKPFMDDGKVILQVHATNGRYGMHYDIENTDGWTIKTRGQWIDVPTKSGGNGRLRYTRDASITFDLLRVRRPHGFTSVAWAPGACR
jgi:hypothetical protein